jgi:hypothetical protein
MRLMSAHVSKVNASIRLLLLEWSPYTFSIISSYEVQRHTAGGTTLSNRPLPRSSRNDEYDNNDQLITKMRRLQHSHAYLLAATLTQ